MHIDYNQFIKSTAFIHINGFCVGSSISRMKSAATFRNVHAKTGSFTAINTLAGYLKMKNGHEVAFAIMNQNVLSAAKARAFQDKVCEVIIRR